jgi:predicted transglutaminase-like cysteine proteinase
MRAIQISFVTFLILLTIGVARCEAAEYQSTYLNPRWSAVKDRVFLTPNVERLRRADLSDQLEAVNRWANRVDYVPDNGDHWKTPTETLAEGGDCEDYAILKFYALLDLGVPNDNMRILVMQDHAVLAVRLDDWVILDNLPPTLKSADRYQPVYAFNLTHHWQFIY